MVGRVSGYKTLRICPDYDLFTTEAFLSYFEICEHKYSLENVESSWEIFENKTEFLLKPIANAAKLHKRCWLEQCTFIKSISKIFFPLLSSFMIQKKNLWIQKSASESSTMIVSSLNLHSILTLNFTELIF